MSPCSLVVSRDTGFAIVRVACLAYPNRTRQARKGLRRMKQELGHLVSGRFSGAHPDPNFVVRERGVAVSDAQAETGEVADVDHHPGLGLRPHAASPATHDVGGGLDGDDQLSLRLDHVEDAEPVQSQKRLRQPGTVAHRQWSPVVAAVEKPQRWRDLWREW